MEKYNIYQLGNHEYCLTGEGKVILFRSVREIFAGMHYMNLEIEHFKIVRHLASNTILKG